MNPASKEGDPREALFAKLAAELGGVFLNEEGWRFDKVHVAHEGWEVTVEFHSHGGYRSESIYTRFRAPVPPTKLRFRLFEQTLLTSVGHLVGMQDITIGDDGFDHMFVVQGTDVARTRRIFAEEGLRRLLAGEPQIEAALEVAPEDPPALELHLEVPGHVEDGARLRRLYDAFAWLLVSIRRG
ncbi:MAG: hypothetical protein MUE73_06775 [Planctomycetes bacterium]|nr:hypothetical protein [Planctomycetota bacterium]